MPKRSGVFILHLRLDVFAVYKGEVGFSYTVCFRVANLEGERGDFFGLKVYGGLFHVLFRRVSVDGFTEADLIVFHGCKAVAGL